MLPDPMMLLVGGLVLGAGTYALRLGGPVIMARLGPSPRLEHVVDVAAVVLLVAVMVTTALFEGGASAGVARPLGVVVAGVLAWRRAPFVVVVLAAAGVAAGLRLLGVP